MMPRVVSTWAALWRRAAPRGRLPVAQLKMRTVGSDAATRALLEWRPDWKTHAIAAILSHREGAFIDVGANVGQSLLDFVSAPRRSSYLGFEPNLNCYRHLAALIRDNRLERCAIVPAGLADRSGVASLYSTGEVDAGASIRRELRPSAPVDAQPCCLFRFDDLTHLLPEARVALIKIDVEGSEAEVLVGGEQTIRATEPWILCEVLHRDPSAEPGPYRRRCAELMQRVASLGYIVERLVQDETGTTIKTTQSVESFPDTVWTEGSERLCDYLFVREAEVETARRLLLA